MVYPNFHLVVTTLPVYDPMTGTGDLAFTEYLGGTCHGATFDSSGAQEFSTGTEHFVVSEGGRRRDYVTTSFVVPPDSPSTNTVGGLSFTGTELKQTSQNSQ